MRLIAILVVLCGSAAVAEAYPQFQLSSGTATCKECHFSPSGGGLINEYGRDEAGSTLSMIDGNGGFLHGAWTPPESFQLGADFRFVGGLRDDAGLRETLVFPMQMEVYLRPKLGAVSLYVNAGVRGSREGYAPGSREHYLLYEPEDSTSYLRVGRFFPVFGIRTQDHTAYPRRHVGMYLYEEPYAATWGHFGADSEVHVSVFAPVPGILGTADDLGFAIYYEKRNEEATAAYAGQARISLSEADRRALAGGVYKRWIEGAKLMFLAEADAGVQAFADSGQGPRLQALGYVGLTFMATKGLQIGAVVQGYDEDLLLKNTNRQAAELNIQWFPIPHLELHVLTRAEAIGVDVGEPILLVLSQLHYYF